MPVIDRLNSLLYIDGYSVCFLPSVPMPSGSLMQAKTTVCKAELRRQRTGSRLRLKVKRWKTEICGVEHVAGRYSRGGRRVVQVWRQIERRQRRVSQSTRCPCAWHQPSRSYWGPSHGQLKHLGRTGRSRRWLRPRRRRAVVVAGAAGVSRGSLASRVRRSSLPLYTWLPPSSLRSSLMLGNAFFYSYKFQPIN